MTPLPDLMVAPNGARLGKADHPAIPLTLTEIIDTARACHVAGADGLHLHLRDARGQHILDSGLYREAIDELSRAVPGMAVQITTEAVGRYCSEEQRAVALLSGATLVSTSIREIMADTDLETAAAFFKQAPAEGVSLQVILYDLSDLDLLRTVLPSEVFFDPELQVLFVLGRYTANRDSHPDDLGPFITWMRQTDWHPDWAVCAFGRGETACLERAYTLGGKLRVGFENSIWGQDGRPARDNAQRVREIADLRRCHGAA